MGERCREVWEESRGKWEMDAMGEYSKTDFYTIAHIAPLKFWRDAACLQENCKLMEADVWDNVPSELRRYLVL